jgi:hypothetical protein
MESFRRNDLTALSIAVLLSARTVNAHGHDMSKVVEGEYVSAEPIVCTATDRKLVIRTSRVLIELVTGRDIMDSYTPDDAVFWHHLPNWNGPRGMIQS